MLQGATIRIRPSWLPGDLIFFDMSWDTDDLTTMTVPQGPWNGGLALLGGFGTQDGQWDWYRDSSVLELWVPNPVSPFQRHLIANLQGFTLPVPNGYTGTGTLQTGLTPTTTAPDFGWEAAG